MQSTSKTNLQALKPKQNFPLRTLSKGQGQNPNTISDDDHRTRIKALL